MTADWNLAQATLLIVAIGALALALHSRRALQRLRHEHARLALQLQQRQQHQARLDFLSSFDALTGLPNRQQLTTRLREALALAQRTERSVGLLVIAIDQCERINDGAGYPCADLVLREVAARLRAVPREGDTVARLGADEFALLLANMREPDNAAVLALKVLDALKAPIQVAGLALTITASIGVSVCPGDGDDADSLLRHAGMARQRVADQGGNGVQSYTPALAQRAQQRATLERALYHALENNEFELYYQPQLSLETGNITGVEALLRWHHPELGLLGPGRFLKVAEQTGQIVPIGAWVLRTACAQAAAWHQAGYWPTLCVNISACQMQLSALGHTVQQALGGSGLDPAYLELELTERALVSDGDIDATIAVLAQLKQLGVCVALDNVGSGYTSLSYLTNFPIDVIKIDRSAVAALPERSASGCVVLAVIALARALGRKTVAQGVETLAQLDFLERHGCDAIQGHYFSPPLPAAGLTLLLEQISRDYRERLRAIATPSRKRAG